MHVQHTVAPAYQNTYKFMQVTCFSTPVKEIANQRRSLPSIINAQFHYNAFYVKFLHAHAEGKRSQTNSISITPLYP
jgi:hypothetical protein